MTIQSSRSAWETWDCFIILIKVKKRAENIHLACRRPWVWSLLLQKGKKCILLNFGYSQFLPKLTRASETEINRITFQKKKLQTIHNGLRTKIVLKWENCCLNRSTPREPDHKSVIWACFHWEPIGALKPLFGSHMMQLELLTQQLIPWIIATLSLTRGWTQYQSKDRIPTCLGLICLIVERIGKL